MASIQTSRGCAFDCNFCAIWEFYERKVRFLSARGIDPNTAQVMQGSLIVVVMMIAGYSHHRRERAS